MQVFPFHRFQKQSLSVADDRYNTNVAIAFDSRDNFAFPFPGRSSSSNFSSNVTSPQNPQNVMVRNVSMAHLFQGVVRPTDTIRVDRQTPYRPTEFFGTGPNVGHFALLWLLLA
ncbi:MAG TPA: hypothetical protein VIM81_00775 [Gammaproteobacteria bacterium]